MSSPVLLFSVTPPQFNAGLLLVSLVMILASDLAMAQYSCSSCNSPSLPQYNSPSLPQYTCSSCNSPAPINCEWSSWSWSPCSATCGPGVEVGRRFVTRYSDLGGRPCGSETRRTRSCNLGACVTNCQWGEWSPWACTGKLKL